MGNVASDEEGVAGTPGISPATTQPTSEENLTYDENIGNSDREPPSVEGEAVTGGYAINGAQLRGQSVVDSQPSGLSPAASNSQSVRTRNSGLGAESAVGSSHSLYYSHDLDPEEDERRDSTPYRICREDVRRRYSRRPSPHTQYYTPISPAESDDEFYECYTMPEPRPSVPEGRLLVTFERNSEQFSPDRRVEFRKANSRFNSHISGLRGQQEESREPTFRIGRRQESISRGSTSIATSTEDYSTLGTTDIDMETNIKRRHRDNVSRAVCRGG